MYRSLLKTLSHLTRSSKRNLAALIVIFTVVSPMASANAKTQLTAASPTPTVQVTKTDPYSWRQPLPGDSCSLLNKTETRGNVNVILPDVSTSAKVSVAIAVNAVGGKPVFVADHNLAKDTCTVLGNASTAVQSQTAHLRSEGKGQYVTFEFPSTPKANLAQGAYASVAVTVDGKVIATRTEYLKPLTDYVQNVEMKCSQIVAATSVYVVSGALLDVAPLAVQALFPGDKPVADALSKAKDVLGIVVDSQMETLAAGKKNAWAVTYTKLTDFAIDKLTDPDAEALQSWLTSKVSDSKAFSFTGLSGKKVSVTFKKISDKVEGAGNFLSAANSLLEAKNAFDSRMNTATKISSDVCNIKAY
jgi:hypothetical protein